MASVFTHFYRPRWLIPLLCLLGFTGGCTHAEYDLIAPPDLATHIGTKTDVEVKRDPLIYRLIAVDNHLVMRIFNDTDDTMQLLGSESVVVDPKGESHPLHPLPIAAHSFVKLILPPLRTRLERAGPSVGFGFGVIGRADRYDRPGFIPEPGEPYGYGPQYFDVVDENGMYWDWDEESQIRLTLTFMRGEQKFEHSFVFRRVNE